MEDDVNKRLLIDRTKFEFNPITGKLDLVGEFNSDRIVTHERNSAGTLLMTYDAVSGTHIPAEPAIVVDNLGNVVVAGI